MKRALLLLFGLLLALPARAAFLNNGWDWEAHQWAKVRVPQNGGGAVSGSTYLASSAFMLQSKMWGLRTIIKRANLYAGPDTNSLQVPIIYDWTTASQTNDDLIGFFDTDYAETGSGGGLQGNISLAKRLRVCKSTFALNAFAQFTNVHLATYNRSATDEASHCFGMQNAGLGVAAVTISHTGNDYVFLGLNITSAADSNGTGFCLITRTASNNAVTYRNGVAKVTDSSADAGVLPNVEVDIHALNADGAFFYTSRRLAGYFFGGKVLPAQVGPYNQLVQNFQTALNRGGL